MGNAQPKTQQNSQAKFVVIRQYDGSVIVIEQSKIPELFSKIK